MSPAISFDELRTLAQDDDNVVGLILGGSRGKRALVAPSSDFDVYLVVGARADEYRRRFRFRRGDPVDGVVFSLEEFRGHASRGSATEWNRYTFAHVEVEIDKLDGLMQRLVDEKGSLSPEEAHEVAARALDAYLNSYYRSTKNLQRGLSLESHLDAAESIPFFLDALFALHERVRPYNKYLRWELESYPLGGAEWRADRLLPSLRIIVSTGDIAEQQALFRNAELLARERDCSEVVDGWEPDLAWLRGRAWS